MSDQNERELNQELPETESSLETFANRKIAELTARVDNLKEQWRLQEEGDFSQEIVQVEQILADFEISVREILQTDEDELSDDQKKATVETLAKDSGSQIDDFKNRLDPVLPDKKEEVIDLEEESAPVDKIESRKIDIIEDYKLEAEKSARDAMGQAKDTKTAKLIRSKYDTFINFCAELAVVKNITEDDKEAKINERYQEFLNQLTEILEPEPVEVTMQEKKPQAMTSVSLDDLEVEMPTEKSKQEDIVEDKEDNFTATAEAQEAEPKNSQEERGSKILGDSFEVDKYGDQIITEALEKIESLKKELTGSKNFEKLTADLDRFLDILKIKIGQILDDQGLNEKEKDKELYAASLELEAKLQSIREQQEIIESGSDGKKEDTVQENVEEGERVVEEGSEAEATSSESGSSSSEKPKKKSFRERLAKYGQEFKEIIKTKEGREVLAKTAYDTTATIFGVKFATDLALATVGRGDIFNYLKQKEEVKKEKGALRELALRGEKEKVRELIEASTNISAEDKKALLERLELLDKKYTEDSEELQAQKQARVQEALNVYVQNKIKGARIAKDALNTALTAAGFGVIRGGAYFLGSAIERAQKASTAHDKKRFNLEAEAKEEVEAQEAKISFVLKDLVVNSTIETVRALAGKGKTAESKHKTLDRIQALGTVARAMGIASAMIHSDSFSGSIDKLLDNVEQRGIAGGAWATARDNFVQNADKMLFGALPGGNTIESVEAIDALVKGEELPPNFEESPTWAAIKSLYKTAPEKLGLEDYTDEQVYNMSAKEMLGLIKEKGNMGALRDSLQEIKSAFVAEMAEAPAESTSPGRMEFNTNQPDSTTSMAEAAHDSSKTDLIKQMMRDPAKFGYKGPMEPGQVTDWVQAKTDSIDAQQATELLKQPRDIDDLAANLARTAKAAQANVVEATQSAKVENVPTSFEDVIDSSKVKGADSIWLSTRHIFENNAKELGYKGDLDDNEALSKWAENQTANAVAQLSKEQGGNLADLVHDGDKVKLELVDGKAQLSFEASSGIEAGHLSDSNIEKLTSDYKFTEGVGHNFAIDNSSGDQYLEIKSGDDIYKIYDWDRDGRPNVLFPDGSQREMTPNELQQFLTEKNIVNTPEAEAISQAAEADELAKQALVEKIDSFVNKGEGSYNQEMFAIAKERGQLDDIFRHILSSNDRRQATAFVTDYFRDQSMTDNKRDIFMFELGKILGTEEGKNYAGGIEDMVASFDEHIPTTYAELDKLLADEDWVPVKVGNEYALVHKDGGGMFGKAKFFIDTNGDGEFDSIKPNVSTMKEVFAGKRTLGYEGKIPEEVAPSPDEKTFSLKRPEVPVADKAVEVAPAPVADQESSANIENIEVPMSPTLSLAIESLNRGDASLAFDLSKLETADLNYLNKIKTNCEAMIAILKSSQEQGASDLNKGYQEVLDVVKAQIEKAGSLDKAA